MVVVARSVLSSPVMHAIFFGLKRAHQGTLRMTRAAFSLRWGSRPRGSTWLYAVMTSGGRSAGFRARCGNCSSVSRATREPDARVARGAWAGRAQRPLGVHQRQRCVALEPQIWAVCESRAAHCHFTRSGWAQLAVDSSLCDPHANEPLGAYESDVHARTTGALEAWLRRAIQPRVRRRAHDPSRPRVPETS